KNKISMMQTQTFHAQNLPQTELKQQLVDFLHNHLEQYGDTKSAISKAIDYSLGLNNSPGGFTILLKDNDILKGVVVVNQTGMGVYIPCSMLVDMSTLRYYSEEGLGKAATDQVIAEVEEDIALHVEAKNPAKKVYKKFGFTKDLVKVGLNK